MHNLTDGLSKALKFALEADARVSGSVPDCVPLYLWKAVWTDNKCFVSFGYDYSQGHDVTCTWNLSKFVLKEGLGNNNVVDEYVIASVQCVWKTLLYFCESRQTRVCSQNWSRTNFRSPVWHNDVEFFPFKVHLPSQGNDKARCWFTSVLPLTDYHSRIMTSCSLWGSSIIKENFIT